MRVRTVKISKFFLIVLAFLFAVIMAKLVYVALSPSVDGIDLRAFANSRNTKKETIVASRGNIYSGSGEVLAQDVKSYTVIAYLSSSRTTDPKKPYHVVDKEATAVALSPIINMKKETILELLNMDAFQVELGPGGRGLTEMVKEEIENLELPGIDFISSVKRYYPNSNFLSYTIGYAKTDESSNVIGELGLELYYNDLLKGKNGFREYQQDIYGYQIVNTYENIDPAESGNDVYLTIDNNIQMFTEQAITELDKHKVEWASVSVVEAKTGKILGVASSPNFNPNKIDLKNYYDPFVSTQYEPGSTMKIFSWMAAMENGIYNGSEKFKSGSIKIGKDKITDWNDVGWGSITYDEGFMGSSNVGASFLGRKLGRGKLTDFYSSLGFGEKTGITLPNEQTGFLNIRYEVEIASASYGQGISITPIQMVQALTTIANDGVMLKPYIVDKIINTDTGEEVYTGHREEIAKVASKETINAMKKLMRGVVDGSARMSTGKKYNVKGFEVMGKTGTAQIASKSGGYLKGSVNYIRSFAGMFPASDPEVIIYVVASKPIYSSVIPKVTTQLIEDVGTYLNIQDKSKPKNSEFISDNYINKNTESVKTSLDNSKMKPVIIGQGSKIIKQLPKNNTKQNLGDKVFLLTNDNVFKMPNMTNWSRSEVNSFASLIGLKVEYNGYGFVKKQSIKTSDIIDLSNTLVVDLEQKYKEEVKKE